MDKGRTHLPQLLLEGVLECHPLGMLLGRRRWDSGDGAGHDGFDTLVVGGVVQVSRDRNLADRLMAQVRHCAVGLRPLLVLTDGWSAYLGSIRRAFREKVKHTGGLGRSCLHVWPDLHIGTIIKRTEKKRVVEITRRMAHGMLDRAEKLLEISGGGSVLNTAFIERLNGTFWERLASLTRKCRHAPSRLQALHMDMYLIGCTYNFCVVHQELSKAKHWGTACTTAMASGLTDHVWRISDVLVYKVPPSSWVEPKRRGRPSTLTEPCPLSIKQQYLPSRPPPLVRLRKGSYAQPPVSVALPQAGFTCNFYYQSGVKQTTDRGNAYTCQCSAILSQQKD